MAEPTLTQEVPSTGEPSPKTKIPGNRTIIITVIALIIIVGLVFLFVKMNAGLSKNNPSTTGQGANQPGTEQTNKIFNISAVSFKFSLTELRVSLGDRVRINLTSSQGTHDWVIDEFNARTKILSDGQSDSIVFTADKAGTFEYYCSVDSHRQMGMVGNLIVE